MKSICLIILGLFLYPVVNDIIWYTSEKSDSLRSLRMKMMDPNIGITLVLSGRCTNYDRGNGIKGRVYFQCSKLEILASDLVWGDKVYE